MDKEKQIQEQLTRIQEERLKRLALPVAEQQRLAREEGVKELLDHGYITPDEAEQYRAQLEELPTDRKGLVVAYFLSGYYDSNVMDFEDYDRIKDATAALHLSEKSMTSNESISDVCSYDEIGAYRKRLSSLLYDSQLRRAENFVDSKRNRLRLEFLRQTRIRVANALSMPPEKEDGETLDANPYVRDVAISNGYRPRAKSINDTDRQAIETASLYYLDLLELVNLNGEAERRYREVYPKYLSEDGSVWSEEFRYSDELDEAITELGDLCCFLNTTLQHFYNEDSAKDMINFIKPYFKSNYHAPNPNAVEEGKLLIKTDKKEEDLVIGRILNSKFRYLIDEGLC